MKKIAVLLVIGMLIAACTPLERTAYNTVVGAKAFLETEKKAHPECNWPATGPSTSTAQWCVNINKGIAAKDLLIDAITIYCSGPNFGTGGACEPPSKGSSAYVQMQDKLKAAIDNYNQISADIKAVK